MAVERARQRIAGLQAAAAEQRRSGERPSQDELRAVFEQAVQSVEGLDAFRARYGQEELLRQWQLSVRRQGVI